MTILPDLNVEEEGGEFEEIGAGELGFLMRLFERAIEDLDVALRERGEGIENVALEGEVEGVSLRCEFVIGREAIVTVQRRRRWPSGGNYPAALNQVSFDAFY